MLEAMPYLREVRVAYDGSYDVQRSWSTMRARMNRLRLLAVALPVTDACDFEFEFDIEAKEREARWDRSVSKKRYERFAAKVAEGTKEDKEGVMELRRSSLAPEQYQVLCLPDGRLMEVLVNQSPGLLYRSEVPTASLLVADRYVDCRVLHGHAAITLRDVDGDGRVEVAVEPNAETALFSRAATRPVNGTAFLELYAIEPTGFRSLLLEQRNGAVKD
jgi:hypothetical protein